MSFMLLNHVLVSLCLYISSKAMNSYLASFMLSLVVPKYLLCKLLSKWCHLQVISFSSGLSQCGANKVERKKPPEVCNAQNLQLVMLQELSCLISYLLSYLLAWYALIFLIFQVFVVVHLFSHYHFVHTLRGSLVCIMLVSLACDPP